VQQRHDPTPAPHFDARHSRPVVRTESTHSLLLVLPPFLREGSILFGRSEQIRSFRAAARRSKDYVRPHAIDEFAVRETGAARIEVRHRPTHTEALIGPGQLSDSACADLAGLARALVSAPLLVVWDASHEDVDILQTYSLGMAVAEFAVPVAIVLGRCDITEAVRFTEVVARNRGAKVRTFTDVDSAKAWLASIDPSRAGHGFSS
jgi:hypothetical protein